MKKVFHCAHCFVQHYCAVNNWSLFDSFDPCCPNMKAGREEYKKFLEGYKSELSHYFYE